MLKLAILGGVDERVDEAVAEHQHHCELMIPACEVDGMAAYAQKVDDLKWTEADNESTADDQ